jgi:hypothetical protein
MRAKSPQVQSALRKPVLGLPFGKIIGMVDVEEVLAAEEQPGMTLLERLFAPPGRPGYLWRLSGHLELPSALQVKIRASNGLFELEPDVGTRLEEVFHETCGV